MALTPADILAHEDVVEWLGWPFDFEMHPDLMDPEADFTIAGTPSFDVIASDSAGNKFVLPGDAGDTSRPLLYVNHECFAGVIGTTLEEGVQIILTLPYWRDILTFSEGGNLEKMRRVRDRREAEFEKEVLDLEEDFNLAAARQRIRSVLGLPALEDPVAALHANVQRFEGRYQTTFHGGDTCLSVFGTFRYDE